MSATPVAPEDPVEELVRPTTEAGPEVQPLEEIPRDTREVTGGGFRLWAPSEFQQSEVEGPGGVTMVLLERPATTDGGVGQVATYQEVEPATCRA